jgi:hypothetical protein
VAAVYLQKSRMGRKDAAFEKAAAGLLESALARIGNLFQSSPGWGALPSAA